METTLIIGGALGGVIRGLVGFAKHRYSYKDVRFDSAKFLSSVAISGFVGLVSALSVKNLGFLFLGQDAISFAMAVVIGYAGGDFLEGIGKIMLKREERK